MVGQKGRIAGMAALLLDELRAEHDAAERLRAPAAFEDALRRAREQVLAVQANVGNRIDAGAVGAVAGRARANGRRFKAMAPGGNDD